MLYFCVINLRWGYHWLPKWDKSYDIMAQTQLMIDGKMNGYIVQGFNPLAAFADKNKCSAALAKLKYMVVIDPLVTESSNFWQNHGEMNEVSPKDIQTEIFRLPSSCFAEENGSIANSGRWLQWHWAGAKPPAQAWYDGKILGHLLMRLRELYREEGGVCPEPVINLSWNYVNPYDPQPEEVAKEANGQAMQDIFDETGKLLFKKGQQLDGFHQLKSDGSTASFCWVYSGCWTEKGNQMANRDNADPGCLKACPAEGAIIQYANGIVDFQSEHCIGCGYCIAGCPFDVPRINEEDNRAYKCTLCVDRVEVGQEPACVKTCPTGAIHFGSKEAMTHLANERVTELNTRGYDKAGLYDPQGVGGTHVMYVLHHADRPNLYHGLPENPEISTTVKFWKGIWKLLAAVGFAATFAGAMFHYLGIGPNHTTEEDEEEAQKEMEASQHSVNKEEQK